MNFDPDTFMQTTIDAPLETDFTLCPEGEYSAMVGDFTSEAFEQIDFTYKKGDRAGEPGTMTKFNLPWQVTDDAVRVAMGRADGAVVIFQQLILDIGADGGLDFGKNRNIALGRIRAAVNQNQPGPWAISQLRGAGPVMIKVVHRSGKRKDGSEFKRAEVDRVAPIR